MRNACTFLAGPGRVVQRDRVVGVAAEGSMASPHVPYCLNLHDRHDSGRWTIDEVQGWLMAILDFMPPYFTNQSTPICNAHGLLLYPPTFSPDGH